MMVNGVDLSLMKYVMSVHAKTTQPIDKNQLVYDGYELKPGEAVLAVDETNLPNTNVYWREGNKLVPNPNYRDFAHLHGKVRVSLIKDGAVDSRWDILMTDGVETGFVQNLELDVDEIPEQLRELDEKYLTPRVLAGIASGDEYALGQWNKHEEEAAPLRAKLAAAAAAGTN
jgi:hypothetical protein